MADLLTEYLRETARKPFAWDSCNCFHFIFDWAWLVTGVDPAPAERLICVSERSARNIMKAAGGPVAFAQAKLGPLGFRPTTQPQPGDVALVSVPLKSWRGRMIHVPGGAVLVRSRLWAFKAKDAMTYGAFPVIAAWALPHG